MEFTADDASLSSNSEGGTEGEPTCCSYALTGDTPMMQGVYRCLTCTTEAESNRCCCVGCAENCHWEHDVEYIGYGMSYCDCGAGACELFGESKEIAQRVLDAAGCSQVTHDIDGRLAGSKASSVEISEFAEFMWSSLADGDVRRALEEQAEALVKLSKETFWIGAGDSPRCALEAVAAQVFRRHTKGIVMDPCRASGAEWWVQVKPCLAVADDGALGDETAGAIDLHYDKDEFLAERFSVGVYPQISTVTYLTCGNLTEDLKHDSGSDIYSNIAPTVIVDNATLHPIGRAMNRAFISRPAIGKHIIFDGLYLHGVPSHKALRKVRSSHATGDHATGSLAEEETERVLESLKEMKHNAEKQQLRITILVNIWLGHRPAAVEVLSEEIISFLPEVLPAVQDRICGAFSGDRDISDAQLEEIIVPVRDLPIVTVYRSPPPPTPALTAPNRHVVVVSLDNGEWIHLPFVSSDATWGKEDDEDEDLVLKMWLPDLPAVLGREEDTVQIEYINNMPPAHSPPRGSKKKKKRGSAERSEKVEHLLSLGYE